MSDEVEEHRHANKWFSITSPIFRLQKHKRKTQSRHKLIGNQVSLNTVLVGLFILHHVKVLQNSGELLTGSPITQYLSLIPRKPLQAHCPWCLGSHWILLFELLQCLEPEHSLVSVKAASNEHLSPETKVDALKHVPHQHSTSRAWFSPTLT